VFSVIKNTILKHPLWWILGLGVTWRVLRWALGMPLWGDEVMLALNILDRPASELIQPLVMGQVAPPLFLLLHHLIFDITGTSEWSLRFPALVFGIFGLWFFCRLALSVVRPSEALVAVSVLAVSYYVVRYGSEFKPYSLDLVVAVCLYSIAQFFRCRPVAFWPACGFVLVVSTATFFSYPSVFVCGAILLVLSVDSIRRKEWGRLTVLGITGFVFVVLFAANYTLIIAPQQQSLSAAFLKTYWSAAFAPAGFPEFLEWFVRASAGKLMAYPTGGKNFGSVVTLILFCVGIFALARRKDGFLLGLLLLPFVLTILASSFHFYPYGMSPRIAQHLAPSICLLTGIGLVQLLSLSKRLNRDAGIRCVLVFLSLFGLAGMAETIANPYKSHSDEKIRSLVQEAFSDLGCLRYRVINTTDTIPVNFLWYLSVRGDTLYEREALTFEKGKEDPICIWSFPQPDRRLENATTKALLSAYVDKYPDVLAAYNLAAGTKAEHGLWHWENHGRKEGRSIAAAVENAGSRRSVLDSWLEAQKTDLTVRVDQTGSGTSYGTQEHRRLDFPTDYRYRFVMLQRSSVGS